MATNTNAIQYINPINLGGNELLNAKVQILETLPAAADYANQLVSVNNVLYYSNGTNFINISALSLANVTVDNTSTSFSEFITNSYDPVNFKEGDIIIFSLFDETYIHLGTTTDTATDFEKISSLVDSADIRAALFGSGAIDYDSATGTFSMSYDTNQFELDINNDLHIKANSIGTTELKNGEVTEAKLSTDVQDKLNKTGQTFSLADTGVANVTYNSSNGAFTITHNFNTQAVAVVMRDSSNGYRQVPANNDANTVNTVRVYFAEQPTNNQYKVTVIPMVF